MFSRVIGQEDIVKRLLTEAQNRRVAHALLFTGPQGCGKLALALAFAQYLLCSHPQSEDACGQCPSCRLLKALSHPDLHFSFPVIKTKASETAVSDNFISQWKQRLNKGLYFSLEDWLGDMNAANQQPLIYAAESVALQNKLALKPFLNGPKVVIIWMADKMNEECANKLLKLIEEPPANTHFILTSHQPERLLPTIRSRTQCIKLKPIPYYMMVEKLRALYPNGDMEAVARRAEGNFAYALKSLSETGEEQEYFELFVQLMRSGWQRRVKDLRAWSEELAAKGRERQKSFLEYCEGLVRESFVFNFHRPELNYLSAQEEQFLSNFARFINERNVVGINSEMESAANDIEQNANAKIVFFDLALKISTLIRK